MVRLLDGRVVVFGTIHVDASGPEEVRRLLRRERPDLVLLELDWERYQGLVARTRARQQVPSGMVSSGETGSVVERVQALQEQLASAFGTVAGAEMDAALEEARTLDACVDFIDVPLVELVEDAAPGLERLLVGDGEHEGGMDLDEVREVVDQFRHGGRVAEWVQRFAAEAPELYETLISKRNAHMARRVLELLRDGLYEKVVVVVGAAHVAGLVALLREGLGAGGESS
ncbi:MAG: hypothetical protein Kow0069_31970 [Promethearchaeota archaeon]